MSASRLALIVLGLSVGLPGPVYAQDSAKLAEQLARLRTEVESLSEELELERSSAREELESLAARKAELESELQREDLRLSRVAAALEEQKKLVEQARASEADLSPVVQEGAKGLRAYVERSLPFRTTERLAAIDEITGALDAGNVRPSKAVLRLWSLVQDELRLTKESGLYRQPVPLDDGDHLVDVVRVGMVMLFFQTQDGRHGRAVRAPDGWRFEVLGDDDAPKISKLFESFEKQVRVGLFELPASLPEESPR